jgi:hypothetical protein
MYAARNDFLHGNPVRRGTLLPWGSEIGVSLPGVAGLVFRTALAAYLHDRYAREPRSCTDEAPFAEGFDQTIYERALRQVFDAVRER